MLLGFVAAERAGRANERFSLTLSRRILQFGHMGNPPIVSPTYEYIAYIDESGDPGLTKVRPIDPGGASEWLTLGAVVIQAEFELKIVGWVRSLRDTIRDNQGPALHFRTLSDERKRLVATGLATYRLGGFAVLSHKPNMRQWRNPAAEAALGPRGWFYNWCVRLLLERVTDAVERHSLNRYGEPRWVKLVFSQRGGVKYNWLRVYIEVLKRQAEKQTTILTKRQIKPAVIHPNLFESIPSIQSAGCQLADVVTSAFHCAADARGPRWNIAAAEALRPIMVKENGHFVDYSVALQPTPIWRAARGLTREQKMIFRSYHYPL
ncbi:MAG: DUF3800 domain-containing protein [Roseiarcus sp.]